MKRFFALTAFALLMVLAPGRMEAQDDQYLRVYGLIQDGDGLNTSGQSSQALAKYLEAQAALQKFQRTFPSWNNSVVNYRLSYLASRIADLSAKAPARFPAPVTNSRTNPPAGAAPTSSAAAELENQLSLLQVQIRQLQTDNSALQSKLKEALSAQPAALDPRELARARDQIRSLQKENDLFKVNLAQKQDGTTTGVDPKEFEQTKQQLAEANRKLAEQAETTGALALEKKALQNKLNSLIAAPWNETNIANTKTELNEANRKLAAQVALTTQLVREKTDLQAQVKSLSADAAAASALRTENEILKKQVADFKNLNPGATPDAARQLAEARAQIAALQSDKDMLSLQKTALENQLRQSSTIPVVKSASTGDSEARLKQIEHERDDLQKKLDVAQKELYGRNNSRETAARVEELSAQLEVLRTRLGVYEAQKVPYSPEEIALFQRPETTPVDPHAGKKSVSELPSGSVTLVAEAQRDFAARRYQQAEEKYLQVLRQDEKNVYTLGNLAAIQLEMGHFDDSEKHIRQALAVAPEDAYCLSILGYLRFRQQRYDEALNALGRAAKLDPQNAEIQNYLGLTLSQKGQRVAAETALRKAIELDPNYASAQYNLAVIYVTAKPRAVEMARLHYKKALAAGLAPNPDMEKMLDEGKAPDAPAAP